MKWRSTALVVSLTTSPIHARPPVDQVARWQPLIEQAAARFDLPPDWIVRVMRAESAGMTTNDGAPIRSRAGAIGLMQVMPATWAVIRASESLGPNPDDPHDNIMAGAAYLRLMVDRFGYPGAIAAYNAGPARYAAYLAHRASLPTETIAYLASVTGTSPSSSITATTPPRQLLFALRHDLPTGLSAAAKRSAETGLFAVRTVGP